MEDRSMEVYGEALERVLSLGSHQDLLDDFSEWLLDNASDNELANIVWDVLGHNPAVDEMIEKWKELDRNCDLDDYEEE
jgi:hypothetical protein